MSGSGATACYEEEKNEIGLLGEGGRTCKDTADMEREVRGIIELVERMGAKMSEKAIYAVIYVLACCLVGILVHLELYGVAATVAMLIMVDVVTGSQTEEDVRWR